MATRRHATCGTCRANRGELLAPGGVIYEDSLWRLEHVLRPLPMAGWLVLKPKRHIVSIAELNAREAKTLGPLIARTARALRSACGVEKVYVALFAEAKGFAHIHIHLIPRPRRLAARLRGPEIFTLLRSDRTRDRASLREAERVAGAVRRSLARPR